MAERIEDITINYEEDGEQVVKELDKEVLTKGAWTTILFRYQQLDRKTGDWGKTQYSIRRYRKVQGEYRSQSKFNISSADQAKKIIDTLTLWLGKEEQA
jgi:hypothetical protein